MKIKIRKKEDNNTEEQEPIIAEQPAPIEPREQLHNVIKTAEYATFHPLQPSKFEKPWDKKETVIKPKRDIKYIENFVDNL